MKETFSIPSQFFSVVLLIITATISYASFSGEGSPYIFPQLLSVILIITTIADLLINFKKGSQPKQVEFIAVKQFLPGFILILLYVLSSEAVGFYLSSLLFLILIISAYRKPWQKYSTGSSDDKPVSIAKQIISDFLFAVVFIILMYLLFSVVLRVQTPRGLFL